MTVKVDKKLAELEKLREKAQATRREANVVARQDSGLEARIDNEIENAKAAVADAEAALARNKNAAGVKPAARPTAVAPSAITKNEE